MKKVALLLICVIAGVLSLTACKAKPKSLEITKPTTVEYEVGTQKIDLTGAKVGVVYSDNSVRDTVAITEDMLSDYSLAEEKTVTITVNYQNLTGTFDVTVIPKQDYISIKENERPFKTTYGTLAKKENVELRGGKITLHYAETNTTETVNMYKNSDVKVESIDHVAKKITVSYKGMNTSYSFTTNNDEVGYIKVTKLPDRFKFRNTDVTLADIDLSGGEFTIELRGLQAVKYEIDKENGKNAQTITAKSIDLKNGYVTFVCDLFYLVGGVDNEGVFVEGYYDIETVNNWVTDMTVKTNPDIDQYDVNTILNKNGLIDLDGGVVTVSHNMGKDTEIDLSDPRVKVIDRKFSPDDHRIAIITIEYKDDVSTAAKVTATFEVAVGGHTDATELNYYADQLKLYANDFINEHYAAGSLSPLPSTRLETIALEGYKLYKKLNYAAAYAESGKMVSRAAFYVEFLNYLVKRGDYDTMYNALLEEPSTANRDAYFEFCDEIIAFGKTFATNFENTTVRGLLAYEGTTNTIGAFLNSYPTADEAIFNRYKTTVTEALKIIDLFGMDMKVIPSAADILAAYNIIVALEKTYLDARAKDPKTTVVPTGAASYLATTLVQWRRDAMDIIYEEYLNLKLIEDEDGNPTEDYEIDEENSEKVMSLIYIGAFPYDIYVMQNVSYDVMYQVAFNGSTGTRFLNYALIYFDVYNTIFAEDYAYKTSTYLLGYAIVSGVPFIPASLGLQGDPGYYNISLDWLDAFIRAYYKPLNDQYLSVLLDDQFKEFIYQYTPLLEYALAGYPLTGDAYKTMVKDLVSKYNKLSGAQQLAFIFYLDDATGGKGRYSYFEQICEIYYGGTLNDSQSEFFFAVWHSQFLLNRLDYSGLNEDYVKDFINYMESADGFIALYEIVKNNIGFDDEMFSGTIKHIQDSYKELKALPFNLYTVVTQILTTTSYLEAYAATDNIAYGLMFADRYRTLMASVAAWEAATGETFKSKTYTYQGESVTGKFGILETLYDAIFGDYSVYDQDEEKFVDHPLFVLFLTSFNKWYFISDAQKEYTKKGGQFEKDVAQMIVLFQAIEKDTDRVDFMEMIDPIFRYMLDNYYELLEMSDEERALFSWMYYAYYYYLQSIYPSKWSPEGIEFYKNAFIANMEGREQAELDENGDPVLDDDENPVTKHIKGCIEQYNDLTEGDNDVSELFKEQQLEAMYNYLLEIYETLTATPTPDPVP